jgi:hypothetical protein
MFPTTDNPAQRLHDILKDAATRPAGQPVIEIWSAIFGFQPNDIICFYRTAEYLNSLLDDTEFRIRQLADLNHDLYLGDVQSIRRSILPKSTGDSWQSMAAPLLHGALTSLAFCAHELSKHHKEVNITKEDLSSISEEASKLYKSIVNAELDQDLKTVLFDLITTIKMAVDNFKIRGADGLKRSVVYAAGIIKLHEARFRNTSKIPDVMEVFRFVGTVVSLVKVAYNISELPEGVSSIFSIDAPSQD